MNAASYGIIGELETANFQPPNHAEQERFDMAAQTLTQSRLKELLHYDPETGDFTRLIAAKYKPTTAGCMAGDIAGFCTGDGYRGMKIDRKIYRMHRLAFLYMAGNLPCGEVDHINGDPFDNRWSNLRVVTCSENARNRKLGSNNISGVMGVHWSNGSKKWVSRIKLNRDFIHIGTFCDWFEAVCARKSAEVKYGFHPNHGRLPLPPAPEGK